MFDMGYIASEILIKKIQGEIPGEERIILEPISTVVK